VYWPCMLLSAGMPLPETVYTHGWWTVRGEKISKSMPATRVDPNQLAEDIGVDALRYYLLREVPLGLDGDFAYENLIGRYNAELAHDLGNLVSRALTVAGKFAGGVVPPGEPQAQQEAHVQLTEVADKAIGEAAAYYRAFAPSRALEAVWRLVGEANRFINNTQPWRMAKTPGQEAVLALTIRMALEAIACAARMLAPVMPRTARQIVELVGGAGDSAATWPAADGFGHELPAGSAVGESCILFPRIDDERQAALLEKWIPDDARPAQAAPPTSAPKAKDTGRGKDKGKAKDKAAAPADGLITFDEFGRLDLRVAQVIEAAAVEGASKLLRLRLDVGEPEPRQVVAGIAETYEPDQLVGRKVIFVANLKPAVIRGVTSQGMILAAGEKNVVGLSALDRDVPVGTKVR
jgi:methionyl-tRNA synthetase